MVTTVATKPIFRDKRRRVWELDFLRGFAVLAMCFDHLMFDLMAFRSWFSNSYEVNNPFMNKLSELASAYWNTSRLDNIGFRFWAHYIFVFLFLFLVGVSCALSRDNTKRGSLLGFVALAFSGVSFVLKAMGIMSDGIVFGILHCIALSILCVAAVDVVTRFNKRVNLYAPLAIGLVILAVGIGKNFWSMVYPFDYAFNDDHFLGYVLGTHAYGDDWFGLFPYVGAKGNSYRRPTIREAFLLMGFSEDEYERTRYLDFSYRKMNKLIGNSIVVNVLEEIFRVMFAKKYVAVACARREVEQAD